MNVVQVNGVTIKSDKPLNVVSRNGVITVNGDVVASGTSSPVEIRVVEGSISRLEADGSVTCQDVTGNVSAGGSIHASNVGGNVSAGGSVRCDKVAGRVSAGGSVRTG